MTAPKAPDGLHDAGRALWRSVLAEYELSRAELHVLELACQAADRGAQAHAEVERLGITVEGRYGPRLNPAVPILRDAQAAVVANLRALGVVNPAEPPPYDPHRPGPKPKGARR